MSFNKLMSQQLTESYLGPLKTLQEDEHRMQVIFNVSFCQARQSAGWSDEHAALHQTTKINSTAQIPTAFVSNIM